MVFLPGPSCSRSARSSSQPANPLRNSKAESGGRGRIFPSCRRRANRAPRSAPRRERASPACCVEVLASSTVPVLLEDPGGQWAETSSAVSRSAPDRGSATSIICSFGNHYISKAKGSYRETTSRRSSLMEPRALNFGRSAKRGPLPPWRLWYATRKTGDPAGWHQHLR
jgi:hypothetical protein